MSNPLQKSYVDLCQTIQLLTKIFQTFLLSFHYINHQILILNLNESQGQYKFTFDWIQQKQQQKLSRLYCLYFPLKLTHDQFLFLSHLLQTLCPQCIENHYQYHRNNCTEPKVESLKNTRNKCSKKLKMAIQQLRSQLQECDFPNQPQKHFQLNIIKIKDIKRQIFQSIEVKFAKYQQLIKKKLNSSIHIYKEIQDVKDKITTILSQLNQQLEGPASLNVIQKVNILDTRLLMEKLNDQFENVKRLKISQGLQILCDYSKSSLSDKLKTIIQQIDGSISIGFKSGHKRKQSKDENLDQKENKYNFSKRSNSCNSIEQSKSSQPFVNMINFNTFKQDAKFKYLHFFQNDQNKLYIIDLNRLQMKKTNKFQVIDVNNKFNIPCFHKSISTPNGDLYLIGGNIESTMEKSDSIFKFNFQKIQLQPIGRLKYGRSSHSLAFMNKYIYIIGGFIKNQIVTNKCQIFDIITNNVQQISSLNYPASSLSCASFNGRYLFKFGGIGQNHEIIHHFEKYDEKKNIWKVIDSSVITNSNSDSFVLLSTMASIQISHNEIFIFGGYDCNSQGYAQSQLLQCDVKNDTYLIKKVNEKPLPLKQAFWNNIPIIYNKMMFALQNISSQSSQDCIENNRRILAFNSKQWKVLN